MIYFSIGYLISDFLLDQKRKLKKLDAAYEAARTETQKAKIRERQDYIFYQAMSIARSHRKALPKSALNYFLGNREKPDPQEITKELQQLKGFTPKEYRAAKVLVVAFVSAWIILKFLGLV